MGTRQDVRAHDKMSAKLQTEAEFFFVNLDTKILLQGVDHA
jgi:hypothetical protein